MADISFENATAAPSYGSTASSYEPIVRNDEDLLSGNTTALSGKNVNGNLRKKKRKAHNSTNVSVFPEQNIVYKWCDINVFSSKSSDTDSKFKKIINSVNCFKGSGGSIRRKRILHNVSGVAYPGELLAIMGSSGAGKTTLLNTLTFRSGSDLVVSGSRTVDDIPISQTNLASISAYVQQNDLFFGNLTVREHLIFHACLRMDSHIPYATRMQRVEEVMSELQLIDCQNTIIGKPGITKGISGGEMKRLSFASEVLTNPPLMFCDEPTSGLDSFMAETVVNVLKLMATKGKTIICTIHQPSSEVYSVFDKILFMSEGRTAFLGTPDEADEFLISLGSPCPLNHNPADFFIELLAVVPTQEEESKNKIQRICNSFENSEYAQRMYKEFSTQRGNKLKSIYTDNWTDFNKIEKKSPYKASWWAQFNAVMWRSWLSTIKEPKLIKVRFLQTIIVSIIVGGIFYQQHLNQDGVMNINGALFLFVTNMTFGNAISAVSVFCSDLPVFLREHVNGMYRTDVYFLCKTFAELPIFILVPTIFVFVVYYLIGLNPSFHHFLICLIIVVLVSTAASSFGYLVSCVSPSIPVALSIGPPALIPFVLFGGFMVNVAVIPIYLRWLSYLSWARYGTESLYVNQWAGVYNISCPTNSTSCYRSGHAVLETFSFKEGNLYPDIVLLAVLIVGFRVAAFLGLLSHTRGAK